MWSLVLDQHLKHQADEHVIFLFEVRRAEGSEISRFLVLNSKADDTGSPAR